MKLNRFLLAVASCVLTAGLAAGQVESIEVPAADGNVELTVTILAGQGGDVALAGENAAPDPDGVMVVAIPDSDFVLRTEQSESAADVTRMIPAGAGGSTSPFAGSVCTSRWNAGKKGEHGFVTTLGEGESLASWSRRHDEGLFLIDSFYPMTGRAPDSGATGLIGSSSRDRALTEWSDAKGVRHAVVTKQRGHEAREAWLQRHRRAVKVFAAIRQPAG